MPQNLRSFIIAQVTRGGRSVLSRRSFSSSRRSNGSLTVELKEGIKTLRTISLLRVTGGPLGCYAGYCLHGQCIRELEENRQKIMREAQGHSVGIVDLREKMWSDLKGVRELINLRKKMWSGLKEKMWYDSEERTWSDLKGDMEKMLSDLRDDMEKMWTDRKS